MSGTTARIEAERIAAELAEQAASLRKSAEESPYPSEKRRTLRDAVCLEEDAGAIRELLRCVEGLEAAGRALVGRFDEALPHINAQTRFCFVHGVRYTGPDIKPELDALRVLLGGPSQAGQGSQGESVSQRNEVERK